MKILAIRGKNIASLDGEFSVDFTCDPLFSAGLFAIPGLRVPENPHCSMYYVWRFSIRLPV